jgi:hypothetical protein
MALSKEQKQRNKAANRLRDKAYNARREAFKAAMARAHAHPDVLRLKHEVELASEKISAEVDTVLEAEKALREQISKLEGQLKELHESLRAQSILDLRERRNALDKQYREAEREQELCVRADYPDLFNRYSVVGWTPPPEVQAQMDAIKSGQAATA